MRSDPAPVAWEAARSRRFFRLGCWVEAGLGLLGLLALAGQPGPLNASLRFELRDLGTGLAATLPPFCLFLLLLRSRIGFFQPVRDFLEQTARPLFSTWTLAQLAIISLLAGWGEELLFRGAIQGWARLLWGPAGACILASLLFGLAHAVNLPYCVAAVLLGLYLGGLYETTGTLAAPIVVHAVYDFLALVYLVRFHQSG